MGTSISVLMPAYNEHDNLAELIPETARGARGHDLGVRARRRRRRQHRRHAHAHARASPIPTCATSGCGATRASRRRSAWASTRSSARSWCSWTPTARTTRPSCRAARRARGAGRRPDHGQPGRAPPRPLHQAQHLQDLQRRHRHGHRRADARLQQRAQGDAPRARQLARDVRRAPPLHPGARGVGRLQGRASSTWRTTSGATAPPSSAGRASGGASSTSSRSSSSPPTPPARSTSSAAPA